MSIAPGLDVSPEEERFLRAAFRRFALPYLVAVALLAGAGGWLAAGGSAGSPTAELEELRTRVAELSDEIESSRVELTAASERVKGLETRTRQGGDDDVVSLRGEIRSARNRISDLEQRIERQALPSRISAVGQRLEQLERRVESVAASARRTTSPAAAAPSPRLVE